MERLIEFKNPKRQQGIAAVLLVILLAIALTATSFGMMHVVRNTQEQHVAVHAVTHAQNGAWSAAEIMRQYLSKTSIASLSTGNVSIIVTGADEKAFDITATITDITEVSTGVYHVTATIFNTNENAGSTAGLGVTFLVEPGGSTMTMVEASLDFHHDLDAAGGIQLITESGTLPNINVEGNVNFDHLNITAVGDINATGSVTLGSGVSSTSVYADEDVYIKDTVTVGKVTTLGNYTAVGGAYADVVWANGDVLLSTAGFHPNVNARGSIEVTMGSHGNLKSGGDVTIQSAAGSIDSIQAAGDVALHSWHALGPVIAEGDLTACPATTWETFEGIVVNGSIPESGCPDSPKIVGGANNTVPVMAELTEFTMNPLVIDVWTLKSEANYVFEYDTEAARPVVTVYNIAGEEDGTEYFIGNYSDGDHNDYLCSAFDEYGRCSTPEIPKIAICLGFSIRNACVSYDLESDLWTFNGVSTAPGIMWFNGNVNLSNGVDYTTVLATGDVSTSGSMKLYSVNYAAYDEICVATGAHLADDPDFQEIYHERFSDQYPTNMCDIVAQTFTPLDSGIGNIGIASGGFDPALEGVFEGGNISLGAYNEVWGTVMAGGILQTAGASNIYGYVTAAAQGELGEDHNNLGGATVVDLTKSTETYDPAKVPGMSGGGTVSVPGDNASSILWSRYL